MTGQVVPMKARSLTPIEPRDLEEVYRFAKFVHASESAQHFKNVEAVTVAILQGREIGLSAMQSVNRIAIINGRPSVYGDAIPALLYANGFKLEEKELIRGNTVAEVNGYECTVIRPDGERITRKFTEADAKTAKLLGKPGPWQQYPKRMLQMRARGLAARDGAADVLAGMYLYEEAQDIEPVDITPTPEQDLVGVDPHETDDKLVALLNNPCFEQYENRPIVHHYKTKMDGKETWDEVLGAINSAENREVLAQIPDLFSDEFYGMPWSWAGNARLRIQERWAELEEDSEAE